MDRNNRQSSDIPEPVAKDDEESLAERLRVNGYVLLRGTGRLFAATKGKG